MATRIQLRHGTAAQWTAVNPILAQGEVGAETDTGKVKIGDGTQTWSALSYIQGEGSSSSWGSLTGSLASQTDLATALNGKQATAEKGVASGYAPLDAAAKVPVANLPLAGESARGVVYLATPTETLAGESTDKAVTPYALAASGALPVAATTSAAGLMSSADKIRLDGIPAPVAADAGKVLSVAASGAYALQTPDTSSGGSLVLTLAHSTESSTTTSTSYETLYTAPLIGRRTWHSAEISALVRSTVSSGASIQIRLAVSDGSTTVTAESGVRTVEGTDELKVSTATLTDNAAWTLSVAAKVSSGGTGTLSRVKITADPADAFSPPLVASGVGSGTNGTAWAELVTATILPTALQPDGRSGVIFSGAVTLTGASGAEVRVTVAGTVGSTPTTTSATGAVAASGVIRLDVPYPAVAAPTMAVKIEGRITAGTGTLALPTWQINLEQ